jgi:ribosomal protein S18 acetylase RimI-like enzyme
MMQANAYKLSGLTLRQLVPEDMDAILELQEHVLRELPDPMWYVPSTLREHEENLARGEVFGCLSAKPKAAEAVKGRGAREAGTWDERAKETKSLVGFAVLSPWGPRGGDAYAAKLGEPVEDTFDARDVMVHIDYRRRGIHSAFLRLFAEMARVMGGRAIYATIDPDNLPSVRSFEKAGYAHIKTQPAYDGRLRGFYRLNVVSMASGNREYRGTSILD